jgi:acyl-CoA synthetase (AMP-forming)/AMP-acid ligase II
VGASGVVSYAELNRRVSEAAFRLGGLEVGSRVALVLPKDERYLVLLLAVIRAGGVACPVSTRLPPGGVVALLGRAGCSALISDDKILDPAGGLRQPKPEVCSQPRRCRPGDRSRRTSRWTGLRP